MNRIDSYENTKIELEIFKKRLDLILKYEEIIREEKKSIYEIINLQTKLLDQMKEDLKQLNGIESKLYVEIVINGMKVSRAIDKVAFEEEKDISTLWKNYYPQVKKKIEHLDSMMDNEDKRQNSIFYVIGGDSHGRD